MSDAPVGRPTLYEGEKTCKIAYTACANLYATDQDLAELLDVDISTIYQWKKDFPKFSEAVLKGKKDSDERVEQAFFKRAIGYSHEAEKIFNDQGKILRAEYIERFPPDASACLNWLKNRQPDKWRDKQELEHTGPNGDPITFVLGEKVKPDATKV